ncbi:MAG: 30S ribosomal protein S3 [Candidatus Aenigmatarchaeota archaeon]
MKERIFIQKAKERVTVEEFIRKHLADTKCSNIEVQHTPIVTRIIIYTSTPGLVIGSSGDRIRELVEVLKKNLKIENPQIDVQKINNPDMDPTIVAKTLALSIENSVNYKKLGNVYISRIMSAGAMGCEIIFAGKLSGERSRRERFTAGYLKKCGEPAQYVLKGFAVATPKLGNVGITVKIMLPSDKMHKIVKSETIIEETKKEPVKSEMIIEETKPEEIKTDLPVEEPKVEDAKE